MSILAVAIFGLGLLASCEKNNDEALYDTQAASGNADQEQRK